MATLLSAIETKVRRDLKESSAAFWSSDELIAHINDGIQFLWGTVIDLFEEHFLTIDITNVSMAADATTLTGVPADTFRVHLIEPRDTTAAGTAPHVLFIPQEYNGVEFSNARALTALVPSNSSRIFYQMIGAGYPVGTPTIEVAPKISSALTLRFVYVPGIPLLTAAGNNPIPGQSDRALHAYCIAFALAKEQEDKMPHPGWLAIFKTEKDSMLQRLTPRQTQDVIVVEDLFGGYEGYW